MSLSDSLIRSDSPAAAGQQYNPLPAAAEEAATKTSPEQQHTAVEIRSPSPIVVARPISREAEPIIYGGGEVSNNVYEYDRSGTHCGSVAGLCNSSISKADKLSPGN